MNNYKDKMKSSSSGQEAKILKIITICDHSLIIERLSNLCSENPNLRLTHSFNSLTHLKKVKNKPDVDICLICANCFLNNIDDALIFFNELYKILPGVKPVIMNDDFPETEKVILIKIGVKGFFSVNMDSTTMEKAFLMIAGDEIWASRRMINRALHNCMDSLRTYLPKPDDFFGISPREKTILVAILKGLTNREIAENLNITEPTVKTHIYNVFKKLGVNNRIKAVQLAIDKHII